MTIVKCTYSNNKTITTPINTNLDGAAKYFLGKMFNLGHIEDDLQMCVKVEQLDEAGVNVLDYREYQVV